jgi:hypothetical protein
MSDQADPDDKSYRECVAEIVGVLQKYDMASAITVVAKNRAMFKYFFPTWSCITLGPDGIRFKALRKDYPSLEAQHAAVELSAHIILQMADIAENTLGVMRAIAGSLRQRFEVDHHPHADFDPECEQ